MGFSLLRAFARSDEEAKKIDAILSSNIDKPVLMTNILDIVEDESYYSMNLASDKLQALYRLLIAYYDSCFALYVDYCISSPKLENLLEHNEYIVYHVSAENGNRVATKSEVENGVEELEPDISKAVDDNTMRCLNILMWTFTGMLRYYRSAGLECTYKNGELQESNYQLILRAGHALKELVEWAGTEGSYHSAIESLKAFKRKKPYKYPVYADDEIEPDISVKQLEYICSNKILGGGLTDNQKYVVSVLRKAKNKKLNYKLKPIDISIMRKAYSEIQRGEVVDTIGKLDPAIQELCNVIEEGVKAGLIPKSDIGVKIVGTVRKTGRCSPKQLECMRRTEEKLESQPSKSVTVKGGVQQGNKAISSKLTSIYDALGSGGFDIVT